MQKSKGSGDPSGKEVGFSFLRSAFRHHHHHQDGGTAAVALLASEEPDAALSLLFFFQEAFSPRRVRLSGIKYLLSGVSLGIVFRGELPSVEKTRQRPCAAFKNSPASQGGGLQLVD